MDRLMSIICQDHSGIGSGLDLPRREVRSDQHIG